MVAIVPLWMALMDRAVFGRRLSIPAMAGLVVGFAGVAAWLLQNVRISVVSTYAFVNPVVAVALGTLFLNESIGWTTIVAGGAIVVAVLLIVTVRTPAKKPVAGEASEPLKAVA